MKPPKIQSSLLRLYAHFYGHFGLQLHDINWRSCVSVFQVGLNVFFILFMLSVFYTLDPFGMNLLLIKYTKYKPLFAYFARLGLKYVQPMSYFLSMAFYLVRGPRVVRLLDSSCFTNVFHSTTKARKVLLIQACVTHISFFMHLLFHSRKEDTWKEVICFLCVYILTLYHFNTCNVIFYYQLATYKRLKEVEHRLAAKVLILEEDNALHEIQSLAIVNNELNLLLSMPLLVYLFDLIYSVILFFCMVFLEGLDFGFLIHILDTMAYLFYLASLNNRLLGKLEQIFDHIKRQYEPEEYQYLRAGVGGGRPCGAFHITVGKRWPQWAPVTRCAESLHSRHMRFSELNDVYEAHFTIRTFQLLSLNFPFLFHCLLFILNYVVLITQTN